MASPITWRYGLRPLLLSAAYTEQLVYQSECNVRNGLNADAP